MYNFLKKMAFNIKDVIVNNISLVSKDKKPAVPKAETSFSIFKTAKPIITEQQKEKLIKISQNCEKLIK